MYEYECSQLAVEGEPCNREDWITLASPTIWFLFLPDRCQLKNGSPGVGEKSKHEAGRPPQLVKASNPPVNTPVSKTKSSSTETHGHHPMVVRGLDPIA